jgi:D-glycero-alpha-D-manno-heptose-7-phosphate kinase
MLIRVKAPLRISFAGGGTDVPPFPEREGGHVLTATINRHVFGTLRPRDNHRIQIESADLGLTLDYSVAAAKQYDGNLDLVKAAIYNLGGNNSSGFDLFLHSEAPPGSGLGSSSSLMVAIVSLLKDFKGLALTDYEVGALAYKLEREELGIKGGLQDQYASTFGGFNFIEFSADRVLVNPLRIPQDTINELEHNLILCFTGTTRASDRIIEDQTSRYEHNEAQTLLGLRRQKELAIEMKDALLRRQLGYFGELLHTSWEYKKKLSDKISSPAIDELYEAARKNGAIGGKILGAGGGGYMMLYCTFEHKHKVTQAVKRLGAVVSEVGFEGHGVQTWRVNEAHN